MWFRLQPEKNRVHVGTSSVLGGWAGAMVLGSFQCRSILLLLHIAGQRPAVLAAGAGQVDCLLGDG